LIDARLALTHERLVIAGVDDELAGIDLDDRGGDAIDEVAVVRDQQQRSLVGGEEALEPFDGFDVQVVRGLVEHEDVRRRQKEAREGNSHQPSAGKRTRGSREIARPEP
jgi:hypothetical protein